MSVECVGGVVVGGGVDVQQHQKRDGSASAVQCDGIIDEDEVEDERGSGGGGDNGCCCHLPPPACCCHHQHYHHQHQHSASTADVAATANSVISAKDDVLLSGTNPPDLPPRPQLRPPIPIPNKRIRKYVVLCCACGGVATLLGAMFLTVYLILRSYTSSLDYFETIPTYIPAVMLFVTGLGIMCLARRRNRYAILIKVCGVSCLVCAATCVLVTVTTTVIHMSRLQSLRECVYTIKTQTCTCYSMLLDPASDRSDDGAHYIFNATPDCEVIHGALYSCLRAMFGLSVIGILVCIFCSMLVYQLLSHERKKMYWEQLELRCRYLYGNHPRVAGQVMPGTGTISGSMIVPQRCVHCPCGNQPVVTTYQGDVIQAGSGPQVGGVGAPLHHHHHHHVFDSRLWGSGRLGNLYSPNPGEEANSSGWASSWRLPWSNTAGRHSATGSNLPNNIPNSIRDTQQQVLYQRPLGCSSPDSQYGFSGHVTGIANLSSNTSASYTMLEGNSVQPCQMVTGAPPPPNGNGGSYQWGPPPPYSDPNSPLRRCGSLQQQHQENYVNTNEISNMVSMNNNPPNNSSINTGRRKCCNMVGGTGAGSSPRHRKHCRPRELTESEVYFADVSSCCNNSIRTDSLVYEEPRDRNSSSMCTPRSCNGSRRKQPRHILDRGVNRIQTNFSGPNGEVDKEFHKIPEERSSPEEAVSEVAMDGSDDDDDTEVAGTFSRSSPQSHHLHHRRHHSHPPSSPMSVSSPSSTTTTGGEGSKNDYFQGHVSDQSDAWGRYSPDLLAPDAQYETIPEQDHQPPIENNTPSVRYRYDRCGNLASGSLYRNSPPSPHYEQIRDTSEHYEPCDLAEQAENNINLLNPLSSRLKMSNQQYHQHQMLHQSPHHQRNSSLVGLVDESQCCHTDSSCRCFISLDNSCPPDQQISPVII